MWIHGAYLYHSTSSAILGRGQCLQLEVGARMLVKVVLTAQTPTHPTLAWSSFYPHEEAHTCAQAHTLPPPIYRTYSNEQNDVDSSSVLLSTGTALTIQLDRTALLFYWCWQFLLPYCLEFGNSIMFAQTEVVVLSTRETLSSPALQFSLPYSLIYGGSYVDGWCWIGQQ